MINCGTDIIEIDRIKDAVSKTSGFLEKVFSDDEIAYFRSNGERYETLAGFFAAKEAFSKYHKTGLRGFKLKDISVKHEQSGAPYIEFCGARQAVSLSISHNKTCAVATVCGNGYAVAVNQDAKKMSVLIPNRKNDAHKGDFGVVTVIAGSCGMTGAAVLSAYSALRTGSGLVTLATAESERQIAASYRAEIMTKGLPSENGIICGRAIPEILAAIKKANAVVFGPGIGQSEEICEILAEVITNYKGKLVIDADGLNALSRNLDILEQKTCDVILTPHVGEMSRLSGLTASEIQSNRKKCSEDFVAKYGVCLVLKGEATVVAAPDKEAYINSTGNVGMATAGCGDVLSGVIASLLGQGLDCFDAAMLGVYIHGTAGDIAAAEKGCHGVVSGDVAEAIPYAIKIISETK